MPELRRDSVRDSWVVVAAEREHRPRDYRLDKSKDRPPCPFCEGNERLTTPELAVVRPHGGPANGTGWTARVVPNLYPALRYKDPSESEHPVGLAASAQSGPVPSSDPAGHVGKHAGAPGSSGSDSPFEHDVGVGRHEVLIETTDHEGHPASYSEAHTATVFGMLRDRVDALRRDESISHVIAFKNHGRASGASLRHPHQQIIAMPSQIPLRAKLAAWDLQYFEEHGRYPLDDQVAAEQRAGDRVVEVSERFCSFVPHASRFSGELSIVAISPVGPFHALPDDVLAEFAGMVGSSVRRVRDAFDEPDFNWLLHAFDRDRDVLGAPWRFDIVPRLASIGGFELSTGATIISISPERAAERLRSAGSESADR